MNTAQFFKAFEETLKQAELDFSKGKDNITIRYSIYTGMELQVFADDTNGLSFYFYERTGSWAYDDERTDIHDVFSLILTLWCQKFNGYSSIIYDVGHPADSSLNDFEIYARFILPAQIDVNLSKISEESLNEIQSLSLMIGVLQTFIWRTFGGCPCQDCRKSLNIKYDYRNYLDKVLINKIHAALGQVTNYNLKDRSLPTWKYYRDFNKGISIVKSAPFTRFIASLSPDNQTQLDSINGRLILGNKNTSHFLSNKIISKANEIFMQLEPKNKLRNLFHVIENRVVALGKAYFLIFDSNSGIEAFSKERGILRVRHDKEFAALFKPTGLEWCEEIDDSSFEDLVAELLRREPNVINVRKVAHTNEADGGKDLIIELKIIPKNGEILSDKIIPYAVINVIVQCKAYKNGVSKTDVLDIRDTIEDYEYDGFLLVVSSYTKRNLTEHLDRLKRKGKFWIDWWTRTQLEERIVQHQDIIHSFPKVFTVKDI